jgi:hypothetical protein
MAAQAASAVFQGLSGFSKSSHRFVLLRLMVREEWLADARNTHSQGELNRARNEAAEHSFELV